MARPSTAMPSPTSRPLGLLRRTLRPVLLCLPLALTLACGGLSSLTGSSTTTAPVISTFTPTAMTVGNVVTFTGSGFTNTSSVTLNGVAVPNWVATSDTQLTAQIPNNAITGPFQITTTGGVAASATFTVIPTISSFSPTSGPVGTVITLLGSGFVGATSATIGTETTATGTPTILSANELLTSVDANATTGSILVMASGLNASSETQMFTVTAQ